jgi:PAS domain S-box-containing protein
VHSHAVNPRPGKGGSGDDLAERLEQAEAALRERKLDLQLMVDSIPAQVAVLTPTGEVVTLNQPCLEYFGRTLEDLKGWASSDPVHPEDLPQVVKVLTHALETGETYEVESRHRRYDGVYRWFHVRGFPLRDIDGSILRWCVLLTDIDDRKWAEVQRDRTIQELQAQQSMLSESEQRFRAIFDEAGTGITLVDLQQPDTPIQNNRALQTMLGLSEEALGLFETYDELTADADREADAAAFRELCEGKRDSLRQEKHFILPDGRSVWANVIFTLLRDSAGLPRFVIAIHQDITGRKRAVEELQAKQDLLDLAQKSARAMAFDWYIQQEVNVWSPQQEALYGLPPGSFDGTYQSWKKLIYPPDWPLLLKAITHAHGTGDVSVEFRVKWPDGSLHWLATNGQMFFDEQGKPFRMVGFTSDISRRKIIEEELRRSAAFLAQAQQLSRTGSFSWRVATDEIAWSDELYRIYEFDPRITITFDIIRTRVHPEDLSLYEKMVEQGRNGADDFEWQYRLLMPDQSVKYMHAVAQATRDPNGQLEYIAAVQDVTRRKLIEEEMRRSEAFLAEGQRLSTTGSFVWRPDSDEIVFSDELKRIFGFELGMPVTLERIVGCVHPDDMSLVAEKIAQARAGGGDHDYELRLRMPDGAVKYLHTNARANRRPDGYLEFVGAMQDVTLRRLAEEALGKARSELAHATRIMSLGVLTASIAHEVNQPLSGIITNASTCVRMLDGDPPNVDGARETAKRTIRDGRRAADVIARLRALFTHKDGATEFVDLNEATREVISLSRTELERNGVVAKIELDDELPPVIGDRVQLQQVILNLLRNGAEAMSHVDDRPRELLFRTEVEEPDRVRLSVQDAGIGLEPQSLHRLFQTFYTTKEEGMGIGLAVSHSIIENHRGRLWATPNDGPGVTFSFSIPCAEAHLRGLRNVPS